MDPALIFPVLTGAISVLFWALIKEKDARISQLEQDNKALELKVEKMSDVLAKNTAALGQAAAAQETVAHLLGTLVPPTSPSSRETPTR